MSNLELNTEEALDKIKRITEKHTKAIESLFGRRIAEKGIDPGDDFRAEMRDSVNRLIQCHMIYGESLLSVDLKGKKFDVRIPPIPDKPIVDNIHIDINPTIHPFPAHLENAMTLLHLRKGR